MCEQSWHRDKVAWPENQFKRVNGEWLQDLAAGAPYPKVSDVQGRPMQLDGNNVQTSGTWIRKTSLV